MATKTKTKPTVQVHYDTNGLRENEITTFLHCGKCLDEYMTGDDPDGRPLRTVMAPKDYARTQAGITTTGQLQIWCNRHECNVAVLSFTVKE